MVAWLLQTVRFLFLFSFPLYSSFSASFPLRPLSVASFLALHAARRITMSAPPNMSMVDTASPYRLPHSAPHAPPASAAHMGMPHLAPDATPASFEVQFRGLIPCSDANVIIGKGGRSAAEIRQLSGARIQVSASVPDNPERLLTVSGPLEAVARAFGLLVRRLHNESFGAPSVPPARAQPGVPSSSVYTWHILVPTNQIGWIIGKAASTIKEIQKVSGGARIMASETVLEGTTERILTIVGIADQVHIAVYYIGLILSEHTDRSGGATNIVQPASSPLVSAPAAGPLSVAPGASGPGSVPGPGPGSPFPLGGPGAGVGPGAGGPGLPSAAPPLRLGVPPPGASQTQQIYIPDDLVGSVIGKGGAKINEIRQASGTAIKIMDPSGAPERLVTVTGHPAHIQIAVNMLHQRVEDERYRTQG